MGIHCPQYTGVAESADAVDSKSTVEIHRGSSPLACTIQNIQNNKGHDMKTDTENKKTRTQMIKEKLSMPHLTCTDCGEPEIQIEKIHFFINHFPNTTLDDISEKASYRCDYCLAKEAEWRLAKTYSTMNGTSLSEYTIRLHAAHKKRCEKLKEMYAQLLAENMADEMTERIISELNL